MAEPTRIEVSKEALLSPRDPSLLLTMTIEIGDGRKGTLGIRFMDDPENLAQAFAYQYDLNDLQKTHLGMLIKQNMEKATEALANKTEEQPSRMSYSHFLNRDPILENRIKSRASNVYERVYKSQKQKKQVTSHHSIQKPPQVSNYGHYLYKQGQKMNEDLQNKIKKHEINSEKFSFNPDINKKSKTIGSSGLKKADKLFQKGKEYQLNKELKQQKSLAEEAKQCTFTPQIIKKQSSSTIGGNKHDALYQDALLRREKKQNRSQKQLEQFNFQPNPQKLLKQSRSQEELADRLIKSRDEHDERMKKARQLALEKESTRDGKKPLFQPEVGRSPTNCNRGNIHEHLYNMRNKFKIEVNNKLKEAEKSLHISATSPKQSEHSQKIYDQFKGKQYAKLFTVLDSDEDGRISSERIHIDSLDSKLLEILTPLFIELDEGKEMELAQFVECVEALQSQLTVDQRAHLFKRERKEEGSQDIQELVSQRSTMLAEKKKTLMADDLYQRLGNSNYLSKMKIQKAVEIKNQEEMKECSFRPTIKKYKK